MVINILNEDQYDLDDFLEWFIKEIKIYLLDNVNKDSLSRFRDTFSSISNTTINVYNLFLTIVDNLIYTRFRDKYVIGIDNSAKFKGINLLDAAELINYGNLRLVEYPIFSDTFNYFTANFADYWEEFEVRG